jgi:uncharacterized protein YkwD
MKRRDYMKKLKHVMAGAALMIMFGLTLNSNVKAEITYDLNGNRVDVSSWTKQTSMKDGSYKIISSESGTIAYFDKEGNLLKVENKATGQIIVNNIKESETTTVKKTDETVTVKDRVTMPKVKKLKKTVKHSYYKGVKSIKKNGKPNMGKIKYDYGIKIYWKKVKGAKGYEVYRYENAKECWTKIKTTKKTSYTLTNMLEGENVKIRIRAYKKSGSGNEYGKYSDTLSFKTKNMYTKKYKNGKTKGFYSKWASEDAFVLQNKLRTKAGVNQLKWSDRIYEIASLRAYMMATKDGLTHAGEWRDEKSILKKWGYTDKELSNAPDVTCEIAADAFKTPKKVVNGWKHSENHYASNINKEYKVAATAVYYVYDHKNRYTTKWCSNFTPDINYDKTINEKQR